MGNRRLIHILLCLLLIFCLILSESCKRKAKVTGEIEEKTEIIVPDFNCDSAYTYVAKQVVDKHINDFKVWLRRFRGVATKYLQSYLMWFVITHKYLTSEIESDIGRLLNLASSDRWAWDEYWRLVNTKYR
jgi:hypothetical protein